MRAGQPALLLDAALAYAAAGRPVFPVDYRRKEPLTAHGFLDATCDEGQIRRWWPSDAGIGLRAGPGWFVLDVDKRDALDDLEQEHGFLPDTRRVGTPRGGLHFYLAGDAQCGTDVPVKGVDIRGEGKGYVIAPPTPGYFLQLAAPMVHPPDWLMGLIAAKRAQERPTQLRLAPSAWERLADGIDEGSRNTTLTSVSGHLFRHWVDEDLAKALIHLANSAWCRPPLPDSEVEQIIDSVAGAERQRREGSGHGRV
jgi:hypothetical protein